jgi:hypothetical protein
MGCDREKSTNFGYQTCKDTNRTCSATIRIFLSPTKQDLKDVRVLLVTRYGICRTLKFPSPSAPGNPYQSSWVVFTARIFIPQKFEKIRTEKPGYESI